MPQSITTPSMPARTSALMGCLLAAAFVAISTVGCGSSVTDDGGGEGGSSGCDSGITDCYIPADCTSGDTTYSHGETIPGGCNDCSCNDGEIICTDVECFPGTCEYNGQTYNAGESWGLGDGCNSCACNPDGTVACTGAYCAQECTYAGVIYDEGSSFPALDGCNTCTCEAGAVGCTELACMCNPAAEWWRDYVSLDPKECELIDYGCPTNTTGFNNECGCGCEQSAACPEYFDCMPPSPCDPEQIAIDCPYSGIAY